MIDKNRKFKRFDPVELKNRGVSPIEISRSIQNQSSIQERDENLRNLREFLSRNIGWFTTDEIVTELNVAKSTLVRLVGIFNSNSKQNNSLKSKPDKIQTILVAKINFYALNSTAIPETEVEKSVVLRKHYKRKVDKIIAKYPVFKKVLKNLSKYFTTDKPKTIDELFSENLDLNNEIESNNDSSDLKDSLRQLFKYLAKSEYKLNLGTVDNPRIYNLKIKAIIGRNQRFDSYLLAEVSENK